MKYINILIASIFLFIISIVFYVLFHSYYQADDQFFIKSHKSLITSNALKKATRIQEALRLTYKTVRPAIVRIEAEVEQAPIINPLEYFFGRPQNRKGTPTKQTRGAGFIIYQDGYIVTNYHVIDRVKQIYVILNNTREYKANIIGFDKISDIALLKITTQETLPVIYIGDSSKVQVGDMVTAVGNPFGLQATLTLGVVSSIAQNIRASDGRKKIQVDAAINPGNSGGPLLNIMGEVIGINQMIYTNSGGSLGIGFAIPINDAMSIIAQLKQNKKIKIGFVGLQVRHNISLREANRLRLPEDGLLVVGILRNSPAEKAGIELDDFITHVDSKIAKDSYVLRSQVLTKGINQFITLRIIRRSKIIIKRIRISIRS